MKCPKCNAEMEKGFLQCDMDSNITWVPKLLPFGLGYWSKEAQVVSEQLDHSNSAVPAYICKRCKLLVGDYSQKELA